MTNARREDIMSQECLSIKDIQELCVMPYPTASEYMRKIKAVILNKNGRLRLEMNGKIHTQDYIDFVGSKTKRYGYDEAGEIAN